MKYRSDRPYHLRNIYLTIGQKYLEESLIRECSKMERPSDAGKYAKRVHWSRIRHLREGMVGAELCELCGHVTLGTDQHHRTYERMGNEWVTDVIFLCQSCHHHVHASGKRRAGKDGGVE